MGIGTSILLIAVGAIFKYAVNETDVGPLEIDTLGTILLILGIFGLILSLIFMFAWDRDRPARRETYVDDVPPRDRYGPPPPRY